MVTTRRLRRSVAHPQALALAAAAHGIERLLLRVMLSSILSEFHDCCLTQQPFYLHASNDTGQPEAVSGYLASASQRLRTSDVTYSMSGLDRLVVTFFVTSCHGLDAGCRRVRYPVAPE